MAPDISKMAQDTYKSKKDILQKPQQPMTATKQERKQIEREIQEQQQKKREHIRHAVNPQR
jgi:hypothetical protein